MKLLAICAIFVLALVILTTQRVAAQPSCRVIQAPPVQYQSSNHDAQTHRRIVRVDLIEVAQINPAYTSSYSPDGYDSATQAELLVEVRRMAAELRSLKSQLTLPLPTIKESPKDSSKEEKIPAPKAITPSDGVAMGLVIMNAKCAACHTAGKTVGNKFALLDVKGNLATLTTQQKLNVITKTYAGEMPPPINSFGIEPLKDNEFAAVMSTVRGN